jgi:hypothetical protein
MTAKPLALPVLLALAFATPVEAGTDFKFVSALDCVAFTPNTQPGELTINAGGIYNAGTTTERVLCPMPRDQDDPYLSNDVDVTVYYRGMGTPGRVTCTLFVGSAYMQTSAIYSNSVVGPLAGNGARSSLIIVGASQDDDFLTVPTNVLCALEPKMAIAGLFFYEGGPTNTP